MAATRPCGLAVDWSYELLDEAERTVLRRLVGVRRQASPLTAAERLLRPTASTGFDVLDLLDTLVRRSMLVADERRRRHARYRLLETIRQFGADRLEESGNR